MPPVVIIWASECSDVDDSCHLGGYVDCEQCGGAQCLALLDGILIGVIVSGLGHTELSNETRAYHEV